MGISVGDLRSAQMDRLRGEIVEVLTAHYAYPAFFDFRAGHSATRPLDRAKREEVEHFLRSVNFSALERTDITSPDLRRFLERLLLRYIEVNPSLRGQRLSRRLPALRTHAARLAAEMQRGLTAHLDGKAPAFGAPRPHPSWATSSSGRGRQESDGEHNTRVLEALLVRRDDAPAAHEPSLPTGASHSQWGRSLADATIPVSATTGAPAGPATLSAPFAAFGSANGIAEAPTGPLEPPPARGSIEQRSLPPDLMNLYGDYLRDMQPEMEAPPPPPRVSAPPSRSVPATSTGYDSARSRPDIGTPAASATAAADGRSDKLIFWQLRYQLEAYARRAAKSYGVQVTSGEPAGVLDALRRSGFVDESDLQLAEGILAITDRVTAAGVATTDDYRQALMLYLLYHRSHLGG